MKVKLSRPCKMGDKEITALDLDLEGLTGEDLVKAEREFLASNAGFVGVPSLQTEYQINLAARAAKVPAEDIRSLPAKDNLALVAEVNRFLT